jgi:hypothetical protein
MNTETFLMKSKRALAIAGISMSAILLAACGGDNNKEKTATAEVQEAATEAVTEIATEETIVTEEAVVGTPETGIVGTPVVGASPVAGGIVGTPVTGAVVASPVVPAVIVVEEGATPAASPVASPMASPAPSAPPTSGHRLHCGARRARAPVLGARACISRDSRTIQHGQALVQ